MGDDQFGGDVVVGMGWVMVGVGILFDRTAEKEEERDSGKKK